MEKLVVIDNVCQNSNIYIYNIESTVEVNEEYLKTLEHDGSEIFFVASKVNIYQ